MIDGNFFFFLGLKLEEFIDKVVDEKGVNCCYYVFRVGWVDVIEYFVYLR